MDVEGAYKVQATSSLEKGSQAKLEAWALLELARRLDSARAAPIDQENLRKHVRTNQTLWTHFQLSISSSGSTLPEPLKVSLLGLIFHVDRQSHEIYTRIERGEDIESTPIDLLIEINREIASSLLEGERKRHAEGQDVVPEKKTSNASLDFSA